MLNTVTPASYTCHICCLHSGEPIPYVDYREDEIATWRSVYSKLDQLFESHACWQHIRAFRQMERECGYSRDKIPQLEDISRYLKSKRKVSLLFHFL